MKAKPESKLIREGHLWTRDEGDGCSFALTSSDRENWKKVKWICEREMKKFLGSALFKRVQGSKEILKIKYRLEL